MLTYGCYPQFQSGQNVLSIVDHPPEIKPGTKATVVSPWCGTLYAIQLPNGEIHRWFAWFELSPAPGNYATIISNIGHGDPPHVPIGTRVKIVKCLPDTIFYDLKIDGTMYHRWLAEFELACPV